MHKIIMLQTTILSKKKTYTFQRASKMYLMFHNWKQKFRNFATSLKVIQALSIFDKTLTVPETLDPKT